MKVLQVNSVCGIGSTGRIATDIHSLLIEQEHMSYIAYGRDMPRNCNNAIKIGGKFHIFSHVAKTRIFDRHGFGSTRQTKEFINQIQKIDPDIIHLHNIHGYYINIEVLFDFLKSTNIPVVWTLHDCWSFTGHCSYFDYVDCEKWKTECFNCPQKNAYPTSFITDNSRWNYNKKREVFRGHKNLTIVTPSDWLANLVMQSYLKKYPVKVINNGIDLNIFKPSNNDFREKHNLSNKFIILGVASVWEQRKGLQYFLELSDKLLKDEIIVLVGLSKQQLKNLPNNIIGISRTNNVEELVDIYSSADVFVNPTLEDNFPTTNLEALACGTPVITFDTGGSGESIEESTGKIISNKTSTELYKNISLIRRNGKEFYKQHCVDRAVNYYSQADKYNEYVILYNNILNKAN